jgi:lysozyme family protein
MIGALGVFDFWFAALMGMEGGYQDDPHDPGNAGGHGTNYGMTQPFFDRYRTLTHQPVMPTRFASVEDARMAYYTLIWTDKHTDAKGVSRVAPKTGFVYADAVVNQGPWAIGNLQAYVGARVDGWFGPVSIARLRLKVGNLGDDYVATDFLVRRKTRYLGTRNFDRYGHGWRERLNHVAQYCDLHWRWEATDHAA